MRQQWPSPRVPAGIAEAAQAMETLHTFAPNLDGPASMRAVSCQLPCADKSVSNVVVDREAASAEHTVADAAAAEHGEPGCVSPVCDATGLPLDLPAEFVSGVQECDTHDPVYRMVAFSGNLELVHELGAQMHAAAQKRARAAADASTAAAAGGEAAQTAAADAVSATAEFSAQTTAQSAALVGLRTVAQIMGQRDQRELESALASARVEYAQANAPQTLHVRSGKPINAPEPQAWPAAVVHFVYADCAPTLGRPRRVGAEFLFNYLLERELEYELASDEKDPHRAWRLLQSTAPLALEHSGVHGCVRRHSAQGGHTHNCASHVEEQRRTVARRYQEHLQRESGARRAVGRHRRASRAPGLGSDGA